MFKRIGILSVIALFAMIPKIASSVPGSKIVEKPKPVESYILKTLTVYNPTHSQCDLTPLITASNARIDVAKLKNQQLRWMALSRNLLKRWNGKLNYGDTVKIVANDPDIDGLWIIQDNLNKRYRDRGDLLFDRNVRKSGIWKNVTMIKV